MHNLSDEEIVKALECCSRNKCTTDGCPLAGNSICMTNLTTYALDLINRLKAKNKNYGAKIQNQREQLKACNEKIKEQQAEIERLTPENERLCRKVEELSMVLSDTIKIRYKEAKSEAIKEFWNELKRRSTLNPLMVSTITGDNLLKEMGCGKESSCEGLRVCRKCRLKKAEYNRKYRSEQKQKVFEK